MMRILLFGEYNECQKAMEYINELPELSNRNKKHRVVDDYDDFYKDEDAGLFGVDKRMPAVACESDEVYQTATHMMPRLLTDKAM